MYLLSYGHWKPNATSKKNSYKILDMKFEDGRYVL